MKRIIALLKIPTAEDWLGGISLFCAFFTVFIWVALLT